MEPVKPILFVKDDTMGASFNYEIYLKNVGMTVARDIVMRACRVSSASDMGDDADQMRRTQERLLSGDQRGVNNRVPKVLAPNTVSAVPLWLHAQEPQGSGAGSFYSLLIGRVDYVDAFSIKHWMTFCYVVANARGSC